MAGWQVAPPKPVAAQLPLWQPPLEPTVQVEQIAPGAGVLQLQVPLLQVNSLPQSALLLQLEAVSQRPLVQTPLAQSVPAVHAAQSGADPCKVVQSQAPPPNEALHTYPLQAAGFVAQPLPVAGWQ